MKRKRKSKKPDRTKAARILIDDVTAFAESADSDVHEPLATPARHCDDWADDPATPAPLKIWLNWARLPAHGLLHPKPHPTCFATYHGRRVRLTMASRFGDVGVAYDLHRETGYDHRVPVDALTNFGADP